MGKHAKDMYDVHLELLRKELTGESKFDSGVGEYVEGFRPRHAKAGHEIDFTQEVNQFVHDRDQEIIEKYDPEYQRDGTLGEVIDRRVQVYGDPVTAFAEIAEMWTTYLGFPVQAHQVPIMQLLMKVVRSKTSPDYSDHSDDIEGYLDIFRKVIGPDMIQARSVNEYIEKKWPGES